jgi:hypothetical protein
MPQIAFRASAPPHLRRDFRLAFSISTMVNGNMTMVINHHANSHYNRRFSVENPGSDKLSTLLCSFRTGGDDLP